MEVEGRRCRSADVYIIYMKSIQRISSLESDWGFIDCLYYCINIISLDHMICLATKIITVVTKSSLLRILLHRNYLDTILSSFFNVFKNCRMNQQYLITRPGGIRSFCILHHNILNFWERRLSTLFFLVSPVFTS